MGNDLLHVLHGKLPFWIAHFTESRPQRHGNPLGPPRVERRGHPVWRRVNQLKSWNLAEGYRKVHFQKGRNQILVRLENGWHTCAFSLVVCTRPGLRS
jgi:hypothetical protein